MGEGRQGRGRTGSEDQGVNTRKQRKGEAEEVGVRKMSTRQQRKKEDEVGVRKINYM